jgi:glycosyltransferase involved in cell wall biosynthesis
MVRQFQQSSILFISSYPPRKCGIASFTQDLANAVSKEIGDDHTIAICALDRKNSNLHYDHPVTMRMDSNAMDSCMETATRISRDASVKLLCIEHEFGLYGGNYGEYLQEFLLLADKPYVIRFHTVLPQPDARRLKIMRELGLGAEKVIVMTRHAASLLEQDYKIPASRITIIPHGTHINNSASPDTLKKQYDLEGKLILTNFGLLSSNKGIEKSILAMKEISKQVPEAVYLVLGQTHPVLIEREGEQYREYLQELIRENKLEEHVKMVNEYIPIKTLMEYLTMTDIYLFTSKDPHQAMSGTFLYAMGAGCAMISNPFVLAKEMLDEQTGIILATQQESELAAHAIRLLKDGALRRQMGRNAYIKTRNTAWNRVAARHAGLFDEVLAPPRQLPASTGQFAH